MGYTPLKIEYKPSTTQSTSLMGPRGLNKRDIQQLLGVENSVVVKNYLIEGDGNLKKRQGKRVLQDNGGSTGGTMIKEFLPDIIIYGYDTTVSAYTISTGDNTVLKSDFTSGGNFEGARYGDYFFVVNGLDNLTRFYRQITADLSYNASGSNTITYTGQTSNFTVGQVLTGGTSGATATITADSDSGISGTLTVTAISGSFIDGEALSDPLGGDGTVGTINAVTVGSRLTGATSGATATVLEISNAGNDSQTIVLGRITGTIQNGEIMTSDQASSDGIGRILTTSALTWNNASVSNAPIASVVKAIGNRLYLGNLKDDSSAVQYSETDDGTNPPFTAWSDSSTLSNGGKVRYRAAGTVRSITNLGPYITFYSDKGRATFFIDALDSGGSIVKKDDFVDSRIDFGGARGAVTTELGVFSASEGGIRQLVSTGQTDVPLSEQSIDVTNILGDSYFDDIDFSDADFVYDMKRGYIFVTCARNSDINNLVLGYFFEKKALIEFEGWNINRFLNIDHTLYGISSVKSAIYKLFDGYTDEGQIITTELYQEIKLGELYTRQSIEKFYIQGRLSEGTSLTIDFDIYDKNGEFNQAVKSYTWTPQILSQGITLEGYDQVGYETSYGGTPDSDGLINAFDGAAPGISNAQRILVRISGSDELPHELNWMNIAGRIKAPIRKRNLSLN